MTFQFNIIHNPCHVFIKHYSVWDIHINYNCWNDWCLNLTTVSIIIKLHYKVKSVGGIVAWCCCNLLSTFSMYFSVTSTESFHLIDAKMKKRTKTWPLREAVRMCIVNGNHFDILYLIPWCTYSNNFNSILEQNATLCSSLRMQVIDFKNYLFTESIICWKWRNVLHYERLIAVRGSDWLAW